MTFAYSSLVICLGSNFIPVLLSVVFLFFVHAFHAAISIRYWFAIDIAIRYRYRSCPAFPIASSDIDSEPERTTTPVAARLRYARSVPKRFCDIKAPPDWPLARFRCIGKR